MFKLSTQESIIVLCLIGAILLGSVIMLTRRPLPSPPEAEHLVSFRTGAISLGPGGTSSSGQGKIIVHITGAVNEPGVYQFDEGARVIDAIKVAGGEKEEAILGILNLAQPLIDGSKIVIPQKVDVEAFRKKLFSYGPEHVYTKEELKLAYGEMEEEKEQEEKKAKAETGKININTASQAQLESLPGIGPKKAQAIIANRLYSSPEEIIKVHGFGPKIYEALRDKITAD